MLSIFYFKNLKLDKINLKTLDCVRLLPSALSHSAVNCVKSKEKSAKEAWISIESDRISYIRTKKHVNSLKVPLL